MMSVRLLVLALTLGRMGSSTMTPLGHQSSSCPLTPKRMRLSRHTLRCCRLTSMTTSPCTARTTPLLRLANSCLVRASRHQRVHPRLHSHMTQCNWTQPLASQVVVHGQWVHSPWTQAKSDHCPGSLLVPLVHTGWQSNRGLMDSGCGASMPMALSS